MFTGKINFYDSRDDKRYGFIIAADGKEIFFHLNDGNGMVFTEIGAMFSGTLPHQPITGDMVCYEIATGRKGPKACPWGYVYELERSRHEYGLKLIPAQLNPDLFPCIADILAEAKRPNDQGIFSVREEDWKQGVLGKRGVISNFTGERQTYFLVAKGLKAEQYLIHQFENGMATGWNSHGVETGFKIAPTLHEQIKALKEEWNDKIAIVEIITHQTNIDPRQTRNWVVRHVPETDEYLREAIIYKFPQ